MIPRADYEMAMSDSMEATRRALVAGDERRTLAESGTPAAPGTTQVPISMTQHAPNEPHIHGAITHAHGSAMPSAVGHKHNSPVASSHFNQPSRRMPR